MYKLVAVGGKIRGKEIVLNEGENVLGRSASCDHPLGIDGVSKQHMRITVNGKTAFVEDLGSSNGTFVNGKLTKKVTVKSKDKIALPNVIFQIVYVKENKVVVKKKIAKNNEAEDDDDFDSHNMGGPMPTTPFGKIRYLFKNKVMPVIYGFNETYEWNILFGILLFIFIGINILLTIAPVQRTSKQILEHEITARGEHYADEVGRFNNTALSRKNFDQVNTNFLEREEGVTSYVLFDLEGRIIRPMTQKNTYIKDALSVYVKDQIASNPEKIHTTISKRLSEGGFGIGKAIKAYDVNSGREEAVGIIAIKFKPKSLAVEAKNVTKSYLEALATSAIVAVVFFGFLYYLTIRHIEELRFQTELVLRGKQPEVNSKLLMAEISPLRNTINSILSRIKEFQSAETGEFNELEDEGPYIRTLEEFQRGAQGPVLVLNSEKNVHTLNVECEDLLGIRENSASGTSLLDNLRDQGLAATVIDLADQSASNDGCNQQEIYEVSGKEYQINVNSLVGKDGFAKAFYVTFVKDE